MKATLAALAVALLPVALPLQAAPQANCSKCQQVMTDIQDVLKRRCGSAPDPAELRQRPIYLFLSIFDEISNGIDTEHKQQIYHAALAGMECDNPDAGVNAAQRISRQLMEEH